MRRLIAMASTAAPGAADAEQEGLVNVGAGANVCDVNVIVENDESAQGQCTNEQNN
jgi:hypothetical protein